MSNILGKSGAGMNPMNPDMSQLAAMNSFQQMQLQVCCLLFVQSPTGGHMDSAPPPPLFMERDLKMLLHRKK